MLSRVRPAVVGLCGIGVVFATGCDAPAPAPTPDPPAESTIGDAGGTIRANDGAADVVIPAGAFTGDTTVTVESRAPLAGEASSAIVSDVVAITLDPPPTAALPEVSAVTFNNVDVGADGVRVARFTEAVGQVVVVDGPADASADYWRPLESSRIDAEGRPTVQVPRFSNYCVLNAAVPDEAPSAEELMPPAAPAGFVYAGAEVVVDNVYRQEHSTLPLDWTPSPDDQLHIRSRTRVEDGVTQSDVIVVHHFVPAAQADRDCPVPADWLVPPPTPECTRYLGYSVVVNFVLVDNTVPLTRPLKITDQTFIRSETVVVDNTLECDIIVAHDFEEFKPDDGGDDGGGDDGSGGDGGDGGDDGSGGDGDALPPGTLDARGGTVTSPAGIEVVIPANALTVPTAVTLIDIDPLKDGSATNPFESLYFSSQAVVGAFALEFDPPLAAQPEPGMMLRVPAQDPNHFMALPLVQPGDFEIIDGAPDVTDQLFMPIGSMRDHELGGVGVELPIQDGLFAVVQQLPECVLPADMEQPPAAPAGHRYMGRMVRVDGVYREDLSTIDPDRGWASTDQVFIASRTTVVDGVACDIVVAHVFEPEQNDQRCIVPQEMLEPPATPDGYRYVGYDVVVNFQLIESTVDLTRRMKSTDISVIRSETRTADFVTECDIIVRHLFEKIE